MALALPSNTLQSSLKLTNYTELLCSVRWLKKNPGLFFEGWSMP